MLSIKSLNNYAGIRLKDNQPLHIKKGINLIVGRNGSGKSNLSYLIKFIFNSSYSPPKRLLESSFLNKLVKKTYDNYNNRIQQESIGNRLLSTMIEPIDFGEEVVSEFDMNNIPSVLKLILQQQLHVINAEVAIKELTFGDINSGNQFAVVNSLYSQGKVFEIANTLYLDNTEIVIENNLNFFRPSSNGGNPVINSIVENFNDFFSKRNREFREQDVELNKKVEELRSTMTRQYNNFFEQTNKQIEISLNPTQYNNRALVLKSNNNVINFESLSDGEKNLFNLIIKLSTAKEIKPELILFDEPEMFMHDDMIKTLAQEIFKLSHELPNCTIIINSHSSVLIEELANYEKQEINLISILNGNVSNSNSDLAFINALRNNGVSFSPLYISKQPNLFIENSGTSGQKHKEFYSSFFEKENQPNIIPIGSSGQVATFNRQIEIIKTILSTQTSEKTYGILDGDMWLSQKLKRLFDDELSMDDLIEKLKAIDDFYIPYSSIQKNLYYFNCWEIENLYLLEEALVAWKDKSGQRLNLDLYKRILVNHHEEIILSWLKTYKRLHFKPIYIDEKLADLLNKEVNERIEDLRKFEEQRETIKAQLSIFYDTLMKYNILQWLPGKEIYNMLISTGYGIDLHEIQLYNLKISKKIRALVL